MSMETLIKEEFKMKVKNKETQDETIEEIVGQDETIEETIEEIVGQDKIEEEKTGVVVDCLALNVRNEPDVTGQVIAVIQVGTKVTISEESSNDKFYSIVTADGISGYCKKQFIK